MPIGIDHIRNDQITTSYTALPDIAILHAGGIFEYILINVAQGIDHIILIPVATDRAQILGISYLSTAR
jgi:hypothetical protein